MPLMVGNILLLFPLILIIFVNFFNPIENHRTNKYFLISLIITLIESVLEIVTLFNEANTQEAANLSSIMNGAGFAIAPFVIYYMIQIAILDTKFERYIHILLIPLIINAVISILSIWFGLIFVVTPDNQYLRGPIFPAQFILNIIYFIIAAMLDFNKKDKYFKEEKICIMANYLLVFICVFIQIINSQFILIWSSITICLIFYYIILQNMQLRRDPLTNVFNRRMYKRKLSECNNKDGTTLIVIDINCFKYINDSNGHAIGDEILFKVADVLSKSFEDYGDLFRTGGDEFCLICHNLKGEEISKLMKQVEIKLAPLKDGIKVKRLLSYGCHKYDYKNDGDIINAVDLADECMYKYKEQYKLKNTYLENIMSKYGKK